MKLHSQSPAVKCQNFHTTLISDAKRWYNKLKLGSIWSWPQLKREFVNAFIGNRTMIADIAQLNDIRLHMRTPFWRDVQNSQPKTCSQLVDLVLREIWSEKMIENREKVERERGDSYRREGRRSPEPRFNRFQK
ncbi:Uncharacterized protein Adt_23496 [Abeliophyllum distichum]|uniref:Retrotransposon gag domain-containing protein n=1 Tax=Abeliophyllum distichum TaxID=126358 RepID=A0ABD1SB16_9LAMI